MKVKLIFCALAIIMMFSACQTPVSVEEEGEFNVLPPEEGTNETGVMEEEPTDEPEAMEEEPADEPDAMEEEPDKEVMEETQYVTKTVTEGEMVSINPTAVDPDGDPITYTFSEPLDDEGEWQTEEGDAGEYIITITASDGKAEVSQKMRIIVEALNAPPYMEELDDVEVEEGDTVILEPEVGDDDGDEVFVEYSGWMTESTYKTDFSDAGEHTVTITASDGRNEVSQNVDVTVIDVNRAPQLADLDDIEVLEGEMVVVVPEVSDLDGDDLEISFEEPLDDNGEWQTEEGDAGTYEPRITVDDGDLTTRKKVSITVVSLNSPPEMEELDDVTVNEGETVTLDPEISDPDGDDIEIIYSGWMQTDTKTTTSEDIGEHDVTITVSDGEHIVSQEVVVTVNGLPQFVWE